MIQNKVLKLKQAATLANGVNFPAGQEIEIVMDVVYIGGFPLPPNMQGNMLNWINNNPNLFTETTMKWSKN